MTRTPPPFAGGGVSLCPGTGRGCVASNRCMSDEKLQHIAERHLEGLPARPGEKQVYAALDLVVWELEVLRGRV